MANITVSDLAREIGVSPQFIFELMAHKRPIPSQRLVQICSAIGVTPEWLTGEAGR